MKHDEPGKRSATEIALDNLRVQNPRHSKLPYDPACYDLACEFLADHDLRYPSPETEERLAVAIQDAIEDFIEGLHSDGEGDLP